MPRLFLFVAPSFPRGSDVRPSPSARAKPLHLLARTRTATCGPAQNLLACATIQVAMKTRAITLPEIALIGGTRVPLGIGIGTAIVLDADKVPGRRHLFLFDLNQLRIPIPGMMSPGRRSLPPPGNPREEAPDGGL